MNRFPHSITVLVYAAKCQNLQHLSIFYGVLSTVCTVTGSLLSFSSESN